MNLNSILEFLFTTVFLPVLYDLWWLIPKNYPPDKHPLHLNHEYDFIIVGAGSAGSVLANRLTEKRGNGKKDWNILLIEAGGDPSLYSIVPAFATRIPGTKEDWMYYAEPSSRYCAGTPTKRCYYPRGKGLGGSSSMNAMMYFRGNKKDYDDWEEVLKNGWDYNTMLKYFLKSEGYDGPYNVDTDPDYHNKNGPLRTSKISKLTQGSKMIIESGEELGFDIIDINGKGQDGFGRYASTITQGVRSSTARDYLSPISKRKNIDLVKEALVTKIIWDGNRAVGVTFKKHGKDYDVRATKEVILSAGAMGSPQILMLSGVGPAKHLKDLKIPVKMDLPVGKNFQDHLAVPLIYKLNYTDEENEYNLLKTGFLYLKDRKGPLSIITQMDAGGYLSTPNHQDKSWPNIQFFGMFFPPSKDGAPYQFLNSTANEKWKNGNKDSFMLGIIPMLIRPKSRGHMFLNSKDPMDKIRIVPNFFDDREDMETFIDGIEICRKLGNTKSMKKNGLIEPILYLDGDPNTRSYWEVLITNYAFPIFHASGTCKMAPLNDSTAVVDPNLKVKGVKGLRVIDASIIPKIVSGNLNAPTIAIAEKGADIIKKDHNF